MAYNTWFTQFYPSPDDAAVSYNTSTTLTAISPGGAANPQWCLGNQLKAGSIIHLVAWGTVSTSATTPNITLGFYYGGTAGVVLASGVFTLTNQAAVAWPWRMKYWGRVTQCGTAGSITGAGEFHLATSLTAVTVRSIPETTAAMTASIDTTINKAIVVGGTWSASAATNIAFCNGMLGGAVG